MLHDLDATLKKMLDDAGSPTELRNAEVSFETPDKTFSPEQPTVNLFLYEVKENRELRDPVPITEKLGDMFVRRRPPLRVDCSYLVTAWSRATGAARVAEEHQLLSQGFLWLSRFPTIPAAYFAGSLVGQPFPPPTLVAQMDGTKNTGEFWSALGVPPRPYFNLVVTIAMDLAVQTPEGPPVVTKDIRLVLAGVEDRFLEITGTVREAGTLAPIANAQVSLVELERVALTDAEGRFRLAGLNAGNYTLRTAASGFTALDKAIVVPGTVLNAYDVALTL